SFVDLFITRDHITFVSISCNYSFDARLVFLDFIFDFAQYLMYFESNRISFISTHVNLVDRLKPHIADLLG
ncbi:hypothetical protein FRC11_003874, partial [Ceratobasidium sp. 423]